MRLSGKNIVVTGGSGFLGGYFREAMVNEGATVVSLDINPISDFGVYSIKCDITSRKQVFEAAQEIQKNVGPVYGLVNNAALNPAVSVRGDLTNSGVFETYDPLDFAREWQVGLVGAVSCSQIFGPRMVGQGTGVIVNIASELGLVAPNQSLYNPGTFKPFGYSVIKHGLIGLTRYLATYWGQQGVRVNALAPGGVENHQPKEFIAKRSKLIPLGRMAQPFEIANALLWLLDPENSYTTGAVISVDGGYTAW